jgi:hypothetical protein
LYVINASDFDPVNAGVKKRPIDKNEIDLLLKELDK